MKFKHGDRVIYPKLGTGTFQHYRTDENFAVVSFDLSSPVGSVTMNVKSELLKQAVEQKELELTTK